MPREGDIQSDPMSGQRSIASADALASRGASSPGFFAMVLALAAEGMFFLALLSAYLVLRAQSPATFSDHAYCAMPYMYTPGRMSFAVCGSILLWAAMRPKTKWRRLHALFAVACGLAFIGMTLYSFGAMSRWHTLVGRDSPTSQLWIYDGQLSVPDHTIVGWRVPMVASFDPHRSTQFDLRGSRENRNFETAVFSLSAIVVQDVRYGPEKSGFFACWYVLITAATAHVAICSAWVLAIAMRRTFFERAASPLRCAALAWHFGAAIWIAIVVMIHAAM